MCCHLMASCGAAGSTLLTVCAFPGKAKLPFRNPTKKSRAVNNEAASLQHNTPGGWMQEIKEAEGIDGRLTHKERDRVALALHERLESIREFSKL